MYEIKVDKESVFKIENTKAEDFKDVKVYVGDPWFEPVDGKIKNLVAVNKADEKGIT